MMYEFDRNLLENGLLYLGFEPSELILDRFCRYHEELLEWNQRINLISKSDESRIITRHFIDSLLPLAKVSEVFVYRNIRMMDLGSGAGFPGIPIGILRKDIKIFLVESKKKKCQFLSHIIGLLELGNISVVPERAEIWCKSLEEPLTVVISRAVTSLSRVVRYGVGALRKGGKFIVIAGGGSAEGVTLSRSIKEANIIVDNIIEVPPSLYHRGGIIIVLSRISGI